MDDYKKRILNYAKNAPIYDEYWDPLKMTKKDKEQQRQDLRSSIGIKKTVTYNNFKSLEV